MGPLQQEVYYVTSYGFTRKAWGPLYTKTSGVTGNWVLRDGTLYIEIWEWKRRWKFGPAMYTTRFVHEEDIEIEENYYGFCPSGSKAQKGTYQHHDNNDND